MLKPNLPSLAAAALSLTLAAGPTSAEDDTLGQVVKVQGTAVISQGSRYLLGQEGTPLKSGNRLITLEGAEVVLKFKDNCQFRMGEDQLFDVADRSPCVLGLNGNYPLDPRTAVMAEDTPVELRPAALGDAKGVQKGMELTPVGTLLETQGRVQVNGYVAKGGVRLQLHARVVTGADGYATLKFTDGQTLALQPYTQLVIQDYYFASGGRGDNRAKFELLAGGLQYNSGVMAKENPHAVKFVTPSGTLAVNDANFKVVIGSLILEVTFGSVTVNDRQVVKAGQFLCISDQGELSVFNSLAELTNAVPACPLPSQAALITSPTLAPSTGATLTPVSMPSVFLMAGAFGAAIAAYENSTGNNKQPISTPETTATQ